MRPLNRFNLLFNIIELVEIGSSSRVGRMVITQVIIVRSCSTRPGLLIVLSLLVLYRDVDVELCFAIR